MPRELKTCELCGVGKLRHDGLVRCDGCYELESRVRDQPELALRVLARVLAKRGVAEPWVAGHGRNCSTDPKDEEGNDRVLTGFGPKDGEWGRVDSVIGIGHNHWDGWYLDLTEEGLQRILLSVNLLRNVPLDRLAGLALGTEVEE